MAIDPARIPPAKRRELGATPLTVVNTAAAAANAPIGPATASAAVAAPGDIEPHHTGHADTTPTHDTVHHGGHGGGGHGGGGHSTEAPWYRKPAMGFLIVGLIMLASAIAHRYRAEDDRTTLHQIVQDLESPAAQAESERKTKIKLAEIALERDKVALQAAQAAKTTSVTIGTVTPGLPPMTVTDNPRPQGQASRDMGFQYTPPAQGAHRINNPGGIRYAILRAGTNDACTNDHQFVVEKNATRWHVDGLNPLIEEGCTQWLADAPSAKLFIIAEGSGLQVIPRN